MNVVTQVGLQPASYATYLKGANFNSTVDQAITIYLPPGYRRWILRLLYPRAHSFRRDDADVIVFSFAEPAWMRSVLAWGTPGRRSELYLCASPISSFSRLVSVGSPIPSHCIHVCFRQSATRAHHSPECSFRNRTMSDFPGLSSKRSTSASTLRGANRFSICARQNSAATRVSAHSLTQHAPWGRGSTCDRWSSATTRKRNSFTQEVVCRKLLLHNVFFTAPELMFPLCSHAL
jgi:hypothetical protein